MENAMIVQSARVRNAILAGFFVAVVCALTLAGDNKNFGAKLSGDGEVPARQTRAHGIAKFQISNDGTAIHYHLNVANINNVVAAHIHVGPAGANGPVVAFLAGPFAPGGGRSNGLLARGTISAADLEGPLLGQPLSALITQMQAGNTYTNVHTNDGVPPINTGAGDFPGGEIRGQNQ